MITKLLLAVPLVLAAWIAVLAGVMLISDDAPAAYVVLPSPEFLANLPDGVAITSKTALTLTVSSDAEGFARLLYEAGATLVLPAGLLGCAPT